jgi:type VI protein secretion system component VasK
MSLRQDVDRAHEILLRQPRLLYLTAIVVTLGAVGYSFRLLFVTPFGSPWLWVTDIAILTLFWVSHVGYRLGVLRGRRKVRRPLEDSRCARSLTRAA